jgi:hypothetical protein
MAITDISIPLQYIKSGTLASRPDGQFEGQIYYATDTNASYVWNSTEWKETSLDITEITTLNLQNQLSILELQAQDTFTANENSNLYRDFFYNSSGYLETVNSGLTTALFSGNSYDNSAILFTDSSGYSATGQVFVNSKTYDVNNYITKVTFSQNASSQSAVSYVKYTYSDLSTYDTPQITGNQEVIHGNKYKDKKVTKIQIYIKCTANYSYSHSAPSYYSLDGDITPSNLKVVLNQENLGEEPSNFQLFLYGNETFGDGEIKTKISFDGVNYQENLSPNTPYVIENKGTSLNVEFELNNGGTTGTALLKGFGVFFW